MTGEPEGGLVLVLLLRPMALSGLMIRFVKMIYWPLLGRGPLLCIIFCARFVNCAEVHALFELQVH